MDNIQKKSISVLFTLIQASELLQLQKDNENLLQQVKELKKDKDILLNQMCKMIEQYNNR